MKSKTTYICNECGYKSPKWLGKCPSCGTWNSMEETVIADEKKKTSASKPLAAGGASSVRAPKKREV